MKMIGQPLTRMQNSGDSTVSAQHLPYDLGPRSRSDWGVHLARRRKRRSRRHKRWGEGWVVTWLD